MAISPAAAVSLRRASCVGRFGIELWFPTFDGFVRNALMAILDGIDREAVDHVKDICGDTLGDL